MSCVVCVLHDLFTLIVEVLALIARISMHVTRPAAGSGGRENVCACRRRFHTLSVCPPPHALGVGNHRLERASEVGLDHLASSLVMLAAAQQCDHCPHPPSVEALALGVRVYARVSGGASVILVRFRYARRQVTGQSHICRENTIALF